MQREDVRCERRSPSDRLLLVHLPSPVLFHVPHNEPPPVITIDDFDLDDDEEFEVVCFGEEEVLVPREKVPAAACSSS